MHLNWFAKSSSRRSGVGKLLHSLGHSWSASPARRLAQTACFVLFLSLFFYAAWPAGATDFEQTRRHREVIDIELFLWLDPLVSITAAIAARVWVWSLWIAIAVLAVGLVVPRAFCGYVCPMGTLLDLFDWAVGRRLNRFRLTRPGWWRNLRYYVLIAMLAAAAAGVIFTGYAAPIPTLTRGLQFIASPVQIGLARGWDQVLPVSAAQLVSIAIFTLVLLLGILRPRFWCRHVCPSGALFSIASLLRLTERKVQPHCIQCGKCSRVCSFDAVNDDFTTVGANCAFCQTCGGVCPVNAIHFTARWSPFAVQTSAYVPVPSASALSGQPQAGAPNTGISRRGFVLAACASAVGGGVAAAGLRGFRPGQLPIRPPGSVEEELFTRLCIRCGQCLRVCPSGILQPSGLAQGLDRLWTPWANADWAGCDPTCNNCGQVCPTGAIAPLSLDKKKQVRMGLAEVNQSLCLQCQGRNDCQTPDGLICLDACQAAQYSAIATDGGSNPSPSVLPDRCVGCGLCQARCFRVNVVEKKLLPASAIRVHPLSETQGFSTRSKVSAPSPSPATTRPQPIEVPYSVPAD